jgi:hypothetical protein
MVKLSRSHHFIQHISQFEKENPLLCKSQQELKGRMHELEEEKTKTTESIETATEEPISIVSSNLKLLNETYLFDLLTVAL